MDHHDLLTIAYQLNTVCCQTQVVKANKTTDWEWAATPIFYPETHCPFCQAVVRSNGIWFIHSDEVNRLYRLVGALFFSQQKVELKFPSHPHDTGSGYLCLGRNRTPFELFASTPNINDCPMGNYRVPGWLKQYWNHTCEEGKNWLIAGHWTESLRQLERMVSL